VYVFFIQLDVNLIQPIFLKINKCVAIPRAETLMILFWKGSPFSQATKALRESRGIALFYFQTSALEGGEGSASRPGRFTPGKDPVPIVQEAGWSPGPVWTGAENLAPTVIRSPDRPAHSQSLYGLSYLAH
jgi:hypothetical protein